MLDRGNVLLNAFTEATLHICNNVNSPAIDELLQPINFGLYAAAGAGPPGYVPPVVPLPVAGAAPGAVPPAAGPGLAPHNQEAIENHLNANPFYRGLGVQQANARAAWGEETAIRNAAFDAALDFRLQRHRDQSLVTLQQQYQLAAQLIVPNMRNAVQSPEHNDRSGVYVTLREAHDLDIALDGAIHMSMIRLLNILGFDQDDSNRLAADMQGNFVNARTLVQFYVNRWHPTRNPVDTFESRLQSTGIGNQAVIYRIRQGFDGLLQ